jgi:hypothetical protein
MPEKKMDSGIATSELGKEANGFKEEILWVINASHEFIIVRG